MEDDLIKINLLHQLDLPDDIITYIYSYMRGNNITQKTNQIMNQLICDYEYDKFLKNKKFNTYNYKIVIREKTSFPVWHYLTHSKYYMKSTTVYEGFEYRSIIKDRELLAWKKWIKPTNPKKLSINKDVIFQYKLDEGLTCEDIINHIRSKRKNAGVTSCFLYLTLI
jgi:hypothetical protein